MVPASNAPAPPDGGAALGLTPQQAQAIQAGGNVLVSAGAGTGKTRVLVERCLSRVLEPVDRLALEEVLMVTFTEAAAAVMRQRLRARLTQESLRRPGDAWLIEQLAWVDLARVCTLHSFCFQLVRDHFHVLGLDPQIRVLDAGQAGMLAQETLHALLEEHYQGKRPADEAVRQWLLAYGSGQDLLLRHLVRRVHDYSQTLPDPEDWFTRQLAAVATLEPELWRQWLGPALADWRREWQARLEPWGQASAQALQCLAVVSGWDPVGTEAQTVAALERILGVYRDWPPRQERAWKDRLRSLFEEAEFLASQFDPAEVQPGMARTSLQEDWEAVRGHLRTLLELAQEFGRRFAAAKREFGAVDFHDLEQLALRLLWDRDANRPSGIARAWQQRLRLVMVDEYQDINAVQDRILQALSRTGQDANRFLVGDVKQSIYRFRLADPHIFQGYARAWGADPQAGRVVALTWNFRSRPGVLRFVNAVFEALMRKEVGGVDYDADARLEPGVLPGGDGAGGEVPAEPPPVELLLRLTSKDEEGDDPAGGVSDRTRAEQEALMVAARLRELRQAGFLVREPEGHGLRPVRWRDMAVLLRSPRNKAESYAKVFAELGIPLIAARRGLYGTPEVQDLLQLLMVLDNPLQDLPALAVLRSPLAGLTANELALIRLGRPRGRFWTALECFHAGSAPPEGGADPAVAAARASARRKVAVFLERYGRWRELAQRASLLECLEAVLDETHYEDALLAQGQGEARQANVQMLLALVRDFDQFQRQGLYRFLRYVQAQQELEFDPEPATPGAADAVRLLSIHQAKGDEFPVVVAADLGKAFNLRDLSEAVVLDESHGICARVQPPGPARAYPSLGYWLAVRRQRSEALGEELRLLYVAMTRACDRLILAGAAARKHADQHWLPGVAGRMDAADALKAAGCLDWLGPLVGPLSGQPDWRSQPRGSCALFEWRLCTSEELGAARATAGDSAPPPQEIEPEAWNSALARLEWRYPHRAATLELAKTSVTALRRRVLEETDAEAPELASVLGRPRTARHPATSATRAPGMSAAEVGNAHHTFLQHVSLDQVDSVSELEAEAARLRERRILSEAHVAALDWAALAAWWSSEPGRRVRRHPECVRRELPFTARFGAAEWRASGLPERPGLGADEFVVVQGVADLVVFLPEALWLVDFKTGDCAPEELAQRVAEYRPQMALYAGALARIHRRPVTEAWLHFLALRRTVPVAVGA